MEMVLSRSRPGSPGRKSGELTESSISFSTSCLRPPLAAAADGKAAGGLGTGNVGTWDAPSEAPSWYGFSPITPEFQRNSQLPESGSKAIDARVAAGSVGRPIIPVHDSSAESLRLLGSFSSFNESMQLVNADNLSSASDVLSFAHSSQETSSSFQFPTGSSLASSSSFVAMPFDSFVCRTSSPVGNHRHAVFGGDDLLCQTASPIDGIYGDDEEYCGLNVNLAGGSENGSLDGSVVDRVGVCDRGRDDAMDSDDEMKYASPLVGDFLSPQKRSSPSGETVKFEKGSGFDLTDPDAGEVVNRGARARWGSSISRTLEELMRHNFHCSQS